MITDRNDEFATQCGTCGSTANPHDPGDCSSIESRQLELDAMRRLLNYYQRIGTVRDWQTELAQHRGHWCLCVMHVGDEHSRCERCGGWMYA